MKENVYEDSTKAAKTPLMIYYAKINDNILWIRPWQNECQQSVNVFWSCKSGKSKAIWSFLYIIKVLDAFIEKIDNHTLCAPSWKWASTEGQQFLAFHHW